MEVQVATNEEDMIGEDVVIVEAEEVVNKTTKSESHAPSISSRSSVTIATNMVTLQKSVLNRIEEKGPTLLQHKAKINQLY